MCDDAARAADPNCQAYHELGDACAPCPDVGSGVPPSMIVLAAVAFVGLVAFVRMDMSRWTKVAALKQVMNFSQVLTITSLVSVQWPPIYRQVQDYLGKLTNIFDVDTVGAECFSPDFAAWDNRFMPVEILQNTVVD